MNNNLVEVTLAEPVKIAGKREPAGATVSVSATIARELDAAGLLKRGPVFETDGAKLASEFDEAVELAVAQRLAEREADAQNALSKLIAAHADELAAAIKRAEATEARVAELEAAIAAEPDTGAGKKPAGKKA